ncbi:MAG: peptide-methionine (S)-S-oxide reductase MsrA [Chloroflexi bacterium]|nr:peptide-methionine (S)-S-oxide reductase MsrA [Chloroflexota bacterium]
MEKATVGGGCFWCIEAIYLDVAGVHEVVSGYAGGHVENPSYKAVCGGNTGHAEVTQITFDPDVISFADILYIFWRVHDPTTLNRQGNDVGPQYRSIILYHDEAQRRMVEKSLAEAAASDLYSDPIVTEIVPLTVFYTAEAHHQNYYQQNRFQPYCMSIIDPKVKKFRKSFADKLKS